MVSNEALVKTILANASRILSVGKDFDKGKMSISEFADDCELFGRTISDLAKKLKSI